MKGYIFYGRKAQYQTFRRLFQNEMTVFFFVPVEILLCWQAGIDGDCPLVFVDWVGVRNGGEQGLGVGVLRGVEQGLDRGQFDEPASVHDGDAVTDDPQQGEVMGDEEKGEMLLLLQLTEEIDDLGLHGNVQGGCRFIGQDQLWLQAETAGDVHPLPLSAGQFIGQAVGKAVFQADLFQEFIDFPGVFCPAVVQMMDPHGFFDDLADGHARIQGGGSILENDLDAASEVLAQGVGQLRRQKRVFVVDFTGGQGIQPGDQAGQGGFAGTGFSGQAQDLPGMQSQGDIGHSRDGEGWPGMEMAGHMRQPQQFSQDGSPPFQSRIPAWQSGVPVRRAARLQRCGYR